MRNVFTSILALLFLVSCKKDDEIKLPPPRASFEQHLGTPGASDAKDIAATSSKIFICGSVSGTGNGADGWLVRMDSPALLSPWQQTFGGAGDDYFTSVLPLGDGGILLTGYSTTSSAGMEDVWVLKLNATGMPVWEKRYGGVLSDFGVNAVQLSNGLIALSAYTQSFGKGSFDHWLMLLSVMNGDTVKTKTYGDNSLQGYGTLTRHDHRLLLCGRTDKNGSEDIDVLVMDEGLDSLSEFIFGTSAYEEPKNIVALGNDEFLLAGHSAGFGHPEHNAYAVKFNLSGNILWERNFGTSMHDGAESVAMIHSQKFLISGRSDGDVSNDEQGYFVVVNANGNEERSYFKGDQGKQQTVKSIVSDYYVFTLLRSTFPGSTSYFSWITAEPAENF